LWCALAKVGLMFLLAATTCASANPLRLLLDSNVVRQSPRSALQAEALRNRERCVDAWLGAAESLAIQSSMRVSFYRRLFNVVQQPVEKHRPEGSHSRQDQKAKSNSCSPSL